jgi:2-polyprenyl-3-methyl-5-hydroxy-6-metoxy-1,4-benzoquinol methylase
MSAADDIIGLYTRHGLDWAAKRGTKAAEGAWLTGFMALLPQGGNVLDLGCGGGEPIAGTMVRAGHSVTGLDASPPLLALARERHPTQGWILDDMRDLALGRTFDGLIAWDSFFHLDHDAQRAMFPRFAAHAAPHAALMFTSGPSHGIALGSFAGETLFHASLDPEEYRGLLAAQGFAVIDHVAEDPSCGSRTVWLARRG